jgi:superfamily I DNA/RNA helicase
LERRVKERCGRDLAARFVSRTFDSFAKSLLDRFIPLLPAQYQPGRDYSLPRKPSLLRELLDQWDSRILPPGLSRTGLNNTLRAQAERELLKIPLPITGQTTDVVRFLVGRIWKTLLTPVDGTVLTFPMITRLAAFLAETQEAVRRMHELAFSHVFLDEFQDTTYAQYDLLRALFRVDGPSILTAVGDPQQRIMGFAGALDDAGARFRSDYKARTHQLAFNHRSAPELVALQRIAGSQLLSTDSPVKAGPGVAARQGEHELHIFSNHREEAEYVASNIHQWIDNGLHPRQVAVLVMKQAPDYAETLLAALERKGVRARVESHETEYLVEAPVQAILQLLRLASDTAEPDDWTDSTNLVAQLRGVSLEDDRQHARVEYALSRFVDGLAAELRSFGTTKLLSREEVAAWVERIWSFLDRDAFLACNPHYAQGSYFSELTGKLVQELHSAWQQAASLAMALAIVTGADTVPICNTHKSKGLEFEVVIFLGLEDGAFYKFNEEQNQHVRTFFVALSRAKQRVWFTMSKIRPQPRTRVEAIQYAEAIRPLLGSLRVAKIAVHDHRPAALQAGARRG